MINKKETIMGQSLMDNKRYRVLLVDDDEVCQDLASHVLRRLGFFVDVVNNGKQAVESCKNIVYDIILMDIQMPIMNGFEATERIAKYCSYDPLIIALSSEKRALVESKCIESGMRGFVEKPIRLSSLKNAISKYTKSFSPESDLI